jgi:hypothetical protein
LAERSFGKWSEKIGEEDFVEGQRLTFLHAHFSFIRAITEKLKQELIKMAPDYGDKFLFSAVLSPLTIALTRALQSILGPERPPLGNLAYYNSRTRRLNVAAFFIFPTKPKTRRKKGTRSCLPFSTHRRRSDESTQNDERSELKMMSMPKRKGIFIKRRRSAPDIETTAAC